MASSQELIGWALENKLRLNLRVIQLRTTESWLEGQFSDFEVTVRIFGRDYVGRAVDRNPELALTKAISESIERAFVRANNLGSSTGVAAHGNSASARLGATSELLERDAFFFHFFTLAPFVSFERLAIESSFPLFFERAKAKGIKIKLYQLSALEGVAVIIVADGLSAAVPFGGIVGLAHGSEFIQVAEKAFVEMARNLIAYIENPLLLTSISENKFAALVSRRSIHRQMLALDIDYWKSIQPLFGFAKHCQDPFYLKSRLQFHHVQLFTSEEWLNRAPLEVWRSSLARLGNNEIQEIIIDCPIPILYHLSLRTPAPVLSPFAHRFHFLG
jgi:hypothetical protein